MSRLTCKTILSALFGVLLAVAAAADTYDTHTLVAVTVTGPEQVAQLNAERVDVVGRRGDVYKVLLTPEQLEAFTARGFSVEILYSEMAEDRRLWAEADAAARAVDAVGLAPLGRAPTFYYTASKFNTTNPGSSTLMKHLLDLHDAYPTITRLYDIGNSSKGTYDILAIKVTKNPDVVEAEPKIRIYANIHGDEKGGLMVACEALDWILAHYATDAQAQKLVDESEMWFIPMGNPEGNAGNKRSNDNGIDLNRNFQGPDLSRPCDETPCWSQPETQAVRDLTAVMGKRFTTGLSFHGGDVCFNSLWNYTYAAPADEPIFWSARTPGSGCSNENGCLTLEPTGLAKAYQDGCTTAGFWYTDGADWYQTWGDTNDWSYSVWSTLDTTLEATATKTPAVTTIPTFVAEHRQAVINYLLKTFQGIHGVMSKASDCTPLDGTVVMTATSPSAHVYKEVYTDPVVGDFHHTLIPGTYTVTCKAAGYSDTVVTGVVVTADTATVINCAMGAPCANSPSAVSVLPNGPLPLCAGTSQTLTCNATGGSGLSYQWYDGASALSGATSSTYVANSTGTHSYNCRVSGSGCCTAYSDAAATTITWSTAPVFSGLASVVNPQSATCTLTLAWSAASSPCAGTVTYKVYRSTTTPVSTLPANVVASGITATSFSDSSSLTNGTPYYYVVHAVDGLGQEDANTIEFAGVPTGTISGSTLLTESFDGATFPPTGWTATVVGASSTAAGWGRVTTSTNPTGIAPHSGAAMAEFNSYHAQSGGSNRLARTATLSIPAGTTSASAVLWVYHETGYTGNADQIQVQTSPDGTTWTNRGSAVNRYDGSTGWKQHTIDLSALIGAGSFRIGYLGISAYGNDTYLDDVSVAIQTAVSCTASLPLPGETAPGDALGTAQTWIDKTTHNWVANAQATGYKVVLGTPAQLPSLMDSTTDSCVKWTGTGTNCTLADTPAAGSFYWFLVIGTNGAGDGSPGNATAGPRMVNSTTGTCP